MKPRLLSISLDKSLLIKPRGNVLERQQEYSQSFSTMEILIPTVKKGFKQFGNLTIRAGWHSTQPFDLITAQDPFLTGLLGVYYKLRYHKPLNIQCHTNFFHPSFYLKNLKNFLLFLTSLITLPLADSIRVVSKEIKPPFSKKTFVAPVFTDLKPYLSISKTTRQPIIVSTARLEKEKNLDQLIKAFKRLSVDYPHWRLEIIGSGSQLKALEALVSRLNLSQQVIFLGQLIPQKIARVYAKASIFCLPSTYEGYGLVFLEAMAAGLAIVSTKVGLAPQVITQANTNSLYQTLKDLISNSKKLTSLQQQAITLAKNFQQNQLTPTQTAKMLINSLTD